MAEIVLVTGKPGAGKTAHVVHMMMHDPIFKNEKGELRKVFTNIKDLQLPHIEVSSIQSEQAESTDEILSFHDVYRWIKEPDNLGSIIIIDEVQDVYPSRSNGSKVPENVSWLNTHRHLGVDIIVITQDPKDIDSRLRNLVNKHYHIARNKLGMRTLLEWKYCANNPLVQAKDAFAKIHKIDDNVKDLYKSAELHTENQTKVTKWVYVIPICLVMLPILFYFSYGLLKSGGGLVKQDTKSEVQTASVPVLSNALNNVSQDLITHNQSLTPQMFVPTLAERPESKPIYDSVRQVRHLENIAGCMKGGKTGCTCYSHQATPLREITKSMCLDYAENGLPFDPFREKSTPNPVQTNYDKQDNDVTHHSQVAVMGGQVRPSLSIGNDPKLDNIQ